MSMTRTESQYVTVMCPVCNTEPIQFLVMLSGGGVWNAAPGARTGTHNARKRVGDHTAEVTGRPDRYGASVPSEMVGKRGAVDLVCRRCGFSRPVKIARLHEEAKRAHGKGLHRITVTPRGDFEEVIDVGATRGRRPRSE
jgi:hypothetical protein